MFYHNLGGTAGQPVRAIGGNSFGDLPVAPIALGCQWAELALLGLKKQ